MANLSEVSALSGCALPFSTQEHLLSVAFKVELRALGELCSCPHTEQRGHAVSQQGSWELTLLRDVNAHTAQDAQRENLAVLSLLQF